MNQVVEKIREEIRNSGAISFARFMECALYCPVYGYYEKEGDTLGRRGDYYTSVSVGPVFGELLALKFSQWLEELQPQLEGRTPPPYLSLVEAGAHRGCLARDILSWFHAWRPDLLKNLQYWIAEPSARRQQWQRNTLSEFPAEVRWAKDLGEIHRARPAGSPGPGGLVQGVIFSNELLDAMPVHRLGWDSHSQTWFEWGVAFTNGCFQWARLKNPAPSPPLPNWPPEILKQLPDGFTVEIRPAAAEWWAAAAGVLSQGYLLTVDYGFENQLPEPERPNGTLRGYRGHQVSGDVLADPGEQDLTAHVDFSALQTAGEQLGLKTETLCTQEQFLGHIAAPVLSGGSSAFASWTPERIRQFQTVTHPAHLGHSFRVLVQSRLI